MLLTYSSKDERHRGEYKKFSNSVQAFAADGRVTTQTIEKATGESRSTIKARLKQLTDDRLLVRYGKGRSTWYGLS